MTPFLTSARNRPGGASGGACGGAKAGAAGQVTALATRASLDHYGLAKLGVPTLLTALRDAGTRAQATALIERLPAAGQFRLFCRQEGRAEQFRFGQEADGRPAKP